MPKKATLMDLINKVNGDTTFRAEFLSNPVQTLQNYGITLSASAQSDLQQILQDYKSKTLKINGVLVTDKNVVVDL